MPRGRVKVYSPEEAKLRIKESQKRFAEKNADKLKEYKREYMKVYWPNNLDKARVSSKKTYEKNREIILAKLRENYISKRKPKVYNADQKREYYEANKEKRKQYYIDNKERYKERYLANKEKKNVS